MFISNNNYGVFSFGFSIIHFYNVVIWQVVVYNLLNKLDIENIWYIFCLVHISVYRHFLFSNLPIKDQSFYLSDTYMQKAKKSYMDSRARRNISNINTELQDVQRIMVQNIDDVLQRGEALSGQCSTFPNCWCSISIAYTYTCTSYKSNQVWFYRLMILHYQIIMYHISCIIHVI